MGYETTIDLGIYFPEKNKLADVLSILNDSDRAYLADYYDDLEIEDGYGFLIDTVRKNYDDEKWIPILKKWAVAYQRDMSVRFSDSEGGWGYEVSKSGKAYSLTMKWVKHKLIER